MSIDLSGQVAVVTGGGRGIGKAHAEALAAAGATVLVNDLGCDMSGEGSDPNVANEAVEAIRSAGGTAVPDATDISVPGAAAGLLARAESELGPVCTVVHAAGVVAERTVLKMDDDRLERMLGLHVRTSFGIVRRAARAMIDGNRPGSIVLHTAPVGFFGALRQSALAATAGAVVGLVRSASLELRKHRIRVNAIAPTARTRTTASLPLFSSIAETSMGPEFVGPVGAFLASSLAAEVSGEIIGVAGTRLYSFRARETPGWFGDGAPPTPDDIGRHWSEITRP